MPQAISYANTLPPEMTENQEFNLASGNFAAGFSSLKTSPEKARDIQVRDYLVSEFKQKMGV